MVRIKSKELLEVSKGFLAPSNTPTEFRRILILQATVVVLGLCAYAVAAATGSSALDALTSLAFALVLYGATVALGSVHVGLYFRVIVIWAVAFFVLFLRRCVVVVVQGSSGSADAPDQHSQQISSTAQGDGDEFSIGGTTEKASTDGGGADITTVALALPSNLYQVAIALVGLLLSALGAVTSARVLRRRKSSGSFASFLLRWLSAVCVRTTEGNPHVAAQVLGEPLHDCAKRIAARGGRY